MLNKINNYIRENKEKSYLLISASLLFFSLSIGGILGGKENNNKTFIDLKTMKLEDKVNLMISTNIYNSRIESILGFDFLKDSPNVGFIHLFGSDLGTISQSKETILNLIKQYKDKDLIPPMFSIDFEGGFVNSIKLEQKDLKTFGFPGGLFDVRNKEYIELKKKHKKENVGLSLLPSAEFLGKEYKLIRGNKVKRENFLNMMREYGKGVANMCEDIGINMVLGPVLDVVPSLNGSNILSKNDRSFGTDPGIVSELGVSFIQGFKGSSVLITPKHFSGTGTVGGDPHKNQLNSNYSKKSGIEIPFGDAMIRGYPQTHLYKGNGYNSFIVNKNEIKQIDEKIQYYKERNQYWSKKNGKEKTIIANKRIIKKLEKQKKLLMKRYGNIKKLIENKYIPPAILVGQSSNKNYCSGIPNTLCPNIYNVISKNKKGYGFNGLKMTDDMYMGAVKEYLKKIGEYTILNSIYKPISAGADIVLCRFISEDLEDIVEGIGEEIRQLKSKEYNKISESINTSIFKILETRVRLGNMKKINNKYYYYK